jgi:outer membrane protein assembly factor BamA
VTSRVGVRAALDSRWDDRRPGAPPTSGVRLDAVIERVHEGELGSWWHSDTTLGAAMLLDEIGEHKLDLRARVELIEPDDGVIVPFLELATVGGSRDLRGFASGRGRDLSAATFTLDYQWPLAAWLDATLYLSAGNVFGERLSGLHAGSLRGSAGFGLGIAGLAEDRQVELWTAVGTEPFEEGLEAAGFRLVLGYSHDY